MANPEFDDYPDSGNACPSTGNHSCSPYKFQLQRDVETLKRKLQEEVKLHAALELAIRESAAKLSDPSRFPRPAQELLSNIAFLEDVVLKLEHEMVSLHFQLSQERNERRLAEYRLRQSSLEENPHCTMNMSGNLDVVNGTAAWGNDNCAIPDGNPHTGQDSERLPRGVTPKDFWGNPNQVAEEMVRCMKDIFLSLSSAASQCNLSTSQSHLSTLSPSGHLSNMSWWSSSDRSGISSWVQSPQIDIRSNEEVLGTENSFDPYRVRGKLSWADIGNYELAREVSWMSVGNKQLEYAAGALRRFRTLVEQLAKVNPIHLNSNEKLAFWINLYNAMIMHAYLAYGVPRSDLKLFSLMQKAAYTVGGHSFTAAAIEYGILKTKPPLHRPQMALLLALHKLKFSGEQCKYAIGVHEPLVAFALSSGMYSSPAVRIYTTQNIREELQEAQRDFIRASVGVSNKGKLLVPKLLHCFAKGFVDDANLGEWISHYLPAQQAAFVERCMAQRRHSFLASRNCGIISFDSRFRYLFLPDKVVTAIDQTGAAA
ncbi:hypothetical protein MLD38_030606 [Melastoma candidum]|uniref:Uncharacterized protein n=1 Tax=Melastoma candidum TaxID=119954 RepID=A0ACB9MNC3_9MYRT|nr:hypothetical protein MLD38_030606 [Melastoma candidum]